MESTNKLKNECQVARDLMPLCADQAASEGSQAYVNDHLAACRECEAYYQGMMSRLPAKTDAERQTERSDFDRVRRRLKHRRALKIALIIALAAALAIAGLYVGNILHTQWYYSTTPASLSAYDVTLAQLSDGRVVVSTVINSDTVNWMGGSLTRLTDSQLHVYKLVFRGNVRNMVTSEPVTVLSPNALQHYSGIYKGDAPDTELVWAPGDEIPAASAEMEAYYALLDYRESTVDTVYEKLRGTLYYHTYDDAVDQMNLALCEAYRDILFSQEGYLFSLVPEWQPFNRYARYDSAVQQPQELLDQCYAFFDGMVSSSFAGLLSATPAPGGEGDAE